MNEAPPKRDARSVPPRVLAVASHPIQYQAPWFRALAQEPEIDFSVLFVQQPDPQQQGKGFGLAFSWDVPLLDGYRWSQVPEIRGRGGLNGFFAARVHRPLALLRKLAPDVLLVTGWHVWPMIQFIFAAWWAGIPIVMRGESNALRKRPWHVQLWHRLLLHRCSAFLPIGRANHDLYRRYGIAEDRLFGAPYFVDNVRFLESARVGSPRREEFREQWKVPATSICFCYAGKLEHKKRILDLMVAFRAAVTQSTRQLHLLVVGSGELLSVAQDLAKLSALPVTFAGFLNQTEIPSAYVAADCLVLPSDHGETWGLVVNEAMACARPAIVSDRVGCSRDLVTQYVTGAVFPFGDTEALATLLLEFAADTGKLQAMGRNAQARVLRDYTVEKSVQGTLRAVAYARQAA